MKLTTETPPSMNAAAAEPRKSVRGLPPIHGSAPNTGGGGGGVTAAEHNEDQLDLNIFQSLRAPAQVYSRCYFAVDMVSVVVMLLMLLLLRLWF